MRGLLIDFFAVKPYANSNQRDWSFKDYAILKHGNMGQCINVAPAHASSGLTSKSARMKANVIRSFGLLIHLTNAGQQMDRFIKAARASAIHLLPTYALAQEQTPTSDTPLAQALTPTLWFELELFHADVVIILATSSRGRCNDVAPAI